VPPNNFAHQGKKDDDDDDDVYLERMTSVKANDVTMDAVDSTGKEVDSALLSGLRDTRERLGLLKLEQVFIDFCNDPSLSQLDIGGPMNASVIRSFPDQQSEYVPNSPPLMMAPMKPATTFQRCLLHRLADRFSIGRQTQENGYIRVLKTPSTKVPSILLLHLKPSEFSSTSTNGFGDDQQDGMSSGVDGSITDGMSTPKGTVLPKGNVGKSKKMKIMKRQTVGMSTTSTTKGPKTKSTSITGQTDKERQYAEARARIFQQSQEDAWKEGVMGDDTTTSTSSLTSTVSAFNTAAPNPNPAGDPTASTATPMMVEYPKLEPSTFHSAAGGRTASTNTAAAAASSSTTITTNDPPPMQLSSKATYRNRQAEQADPDFQRRTVTPPTTNSLSGIYSYGNASGMTSTSRHPGSHNVSHSVLTPKSGYGTGLGLGGPTIADSTHRSANYSTNVNPSMIYTPVNVGHQRHHYPLHQHSYHYDVSSQQDYTQQGASVVPSQFIYNPASSSSVQQASAAYSDKRNHNNGHNTNQEYQTQQEEYRRWNTEGSKASFDAAPCIHSSKDFPSLKP